MLSVLVLASCQNSPTETEPVETEENVDTETSSETSTDRTYDEMWLRLGDLSFYLPKGWSVAEEMQESEGIVRASLNVPDSKYDVKLTMTVTEGTTYDDQEPLAQNQEAKVYLVPCGGAYACYALVFLDEYEREFDFDILSNEPVPENLDGIWTPRTEVTQEELIEFLLGVASTPENK